MTFDVAIVGLGTAGAAAAALCAQRGLRVLGLERKPLEDAGARWVNGVPAWMFDEAGLPRPKAPELRGGQHAFHIVSGWGPNRVVVEDTGVLEVDMRHLVRRLHTMAESRGAELRSGVRVLGFDGMRLTTDQGPIQATWYIDAGGLRSPLRDSSRPVPGGLCAAAQRVHHLADDDAAQAFLHQHGGKRHETLCFTGIAGGYSIINLRVTRDEVSLLTGSVPDAGQISGRKLLDDFVRAHPFIGEARFGGARTIPISGPSLRIAKGRLAEIGDAAGQVHAAHGSGIGHQLLAARLLADTLAAGEEPEAYNLRWQREHGAYLTWAAQFCRFSQSLSPEELEQLVVSRTLHAGVVQDVLQQRPPRPRPSAVLTSAAGFRKNQGVRRRLAKVLLKRPLLMAHYARYPSDPEKMEAWSKDLDRLLGRAHR